MNMSNKPLIVDLDGTLVKTDVLFEQVIEILKRNILYVVLLPIWLSRGRAYLKCRLADLSNLDISLLPKNQQVLSYIEQEKSKGRKVFLATATHENNIKKNGYLAGMFDRVFASCSTLNLSGENKRKRLVEEFGERGFDYIGNSDDDVVVWSSAENAIVVSESASLIKRAKKVCNVVQEFRSRGSFYSALGRQLRLHQWVKNSLIFIPLLAEHALSDLAVVSQGVIGFFCFSILASSVYILNDLVDLSSDRKHHKKHKRPIAAGDISIPKAIVLFPILLVLAFVLAFIFLPPAFLVVLGAYYLATLAYSFKLKKHAIADVITLAMLYTLRIFAGSAVLMILPSVWLIMFSIFIFLSLALLKRFSEIHNTKEESSTISGRGYIGSDQHIISQLGVTSGLLSILVFGLYVNSDRVQAIYSRPEMLWCVSIILIFWIARVWVLGHRGMMDEDPILFAVKDKISVLCGALVLGVMIVSII